MRGPCRHAKGMPASNRVYHVPLLANAASAAFIHLGSTFSGAVFRRRVSTAHKNIQQRTFWLWPISRFGHSIVTQIQTVVQLPYPCGTSLAPQPPSCWQYPMRILANAHHRLHGGTLSQGLHTPQLPAMHALVGYSRSYVRSRTKAVSRSSVTRQIRAFALWLIHQTVKFSAIVGRKTRDVSMPERTHVVFCSEHGLITVLQRL